MATTSQSPVCQRCKVRPATTDVLVDQDDFGEEWAEVCEECADEDNRSKMAAFNERLEERNKKFFR